MGDTWSVPHWIEVCKQGIDTKNIDGISHYYDTCGTCLTGVELGPTNGSILRCF